MLIRYCQSSNFKHHARELLRWRGLASYRPRSGLLRGQMVTPVMSRGHMAPGGTGVSSVGGADTIQGEELKDAKQVTGRDMIRTLTTYIWPRGESREERDVRRRVVTALGLMLGSKVRSHLYIISHHNSNRQLKTCW